MAVNDLKLLRQLMVKSCVHSIDVGVDGADDVDGGVEEFAVAADAADDGDELAVDVLGVCIDLCQWASPDLTLEKA